MNVKKRRKSLAFHVFYGFKGYQGLNVIEYPGVCRRGKTALPRNEHSLEQFISCVGFLNDYGT